MNYYQQTRLKEKGWNDQDIRRAEQALEHAEKYDAHFSKIVFWSALLVIVFANVIVSLILIPIMVAITSEMVYVLVAILAGMIGFLYNFLITDIGHLERKHHLWAGILVPLLAVVNMVMVVTWSNQFITKLPVQNLPQNPWGLGMVFAVAFILPAVVGMIKNIVVGGKTVEA